MHYLEDIMNKEMSRKEFLATLGFGVASIFGLSTIMRFVFGKGNQAQQGRPTSTGYGSSTYGGAN